MYKYKKIIILGSSGSGKSTLANRIGLYTGFPVYHLDNILYNPGWERKEKSKWSEICREIFLRKDVGIVDGNYTSIIPERINWADLVIFIDIPTWLQIYRIFLRNIRIKIGLEKRYGTQKENKEKIGWDFLKWAYRWNKHEKDKIFSMIDSYKDKKVIIISKPKELDIKSLFE